MEINREHFEHWIFNQPANRTFVYTDAYGCAMCAFAAEIMGVKGSVVSPGTLYDSNFKPLARLPDWLAFDVLMVRPLTVGNMQRRYIELFGDPNLIDPALNSERVEGRV